MPLPLPQVLSAMFVHQIPATVTIDDDFYDLLTFNPKTLSNHCEGNLMDFKIDL